jgi:hypothetical protein
VRYATLGSATRTVPGTGPRRVGDAARTSRRPPARPLDDGTTEMVHVIEFVWRIGAAVQPVLWLDRQLLD